MTQTTTLSTEPKAFSGFPTSGLAAVVPNLFFSEVLPEIESAEELIVSIYFFYAASLKRRSPRFVTRRELEADRTFARILSRLCGAEDTLGCGLKRAVERGTLTRATAKNRDRAEDLYAVNTPGNRRALAALAGAALSLEQPLPPADGSPTPNIFALYEENIGSITPLIADQLKDAEEGYPADWIREAFYEAVSLNKRSWRYIERILRRWEAEGRDNEKPKRDPEGKWLAHRYREGKRRRKPYSSLL